MAKRRADDVSGVLEEKRAKVNDTQNEHHSDAMPSIDPELLKLLGDEPLSNEPEYGPEVDAELASKWTDCLVNGLEKEDKDTAKKNFPIPKNIPALNPPTLNPELQMLVNTSAKREDRYYWNIQENMGVGLSAMSGAIDKLIKGVSAPEEIQQDILPTLMNSSALLCTAFKMLTASRKFHMQSKFSRSVRNAVRECKSDGEFLFGRNMAEVLKNMNEKKPVKKTEKTQPKTEVKEEENKEEAPENNDAESMLEEASKEEANADGETPMDSNDVESSVKTEDEHASTTEAAESSDDTAKESAWGPDVHQAIASRWCKFLQHGVETKDLDEFNKKYLVPKNIPYLKPPKMNPEFKEILRVQPRSEDRFMVHIQSKMGVGLSAIAEAVDKLLTNEVGPENFKTTMLPLIADAGKIMCGAYNAMSVNRKYYIENKLEKPFKQAIRESIPDEYICGSAIGLTIKQIQDNLPGARGRDNRDRFPRGHSGGGGGGFRGQSRDRNNRSWRGGRPNRRNYW